MKPATKQEKADRAAAAALSEKLSLLCDNHPQVVVVGALMSLLADILRGQAKNSVDAMLIAHGAGFELARVTAAVIEKEEREKTK